jgi:hypothetical protein
MLCASGLSLGTPQTLLSISVEFSSMHDFTFHFFLLTFISVSLQSYTYTVYSLDLPCTLKFLLV